MNKASFLKLVVYILFFAFGIGLAFVVNRAKQAKADEDKNSNKVVSEIKAVDTSINRGSEWVETEAIAADNGNVGNEAILAGGKFSIIQTKAMVSSTTKAETGETVVFSTAIKNGGSKKKHLTHICFNHSGGATFGCINKRDLDPGEEIEVQGPMMFTQPGNYSVWLTWSQDNTNFYKPNSASSAEVRIN